MDEEELRRVSDYFRSILNSEAWGINFNDLDLEPVDDDDEDESPEFIFPLSDVNEDNLNMLQRTMESLAKGEKSYLIDLKNFEGFYPFDKVPKKKNVSGYKVVWLPDMVAGLLRKRFDKIEATHKAIEEARTKGYAEISDLEKRIEKILTIGNDFLL